jgi:hypothetical protein
MTASEFPQMPPGFVLVRLTDLAALLAAQDKAGDTSPEPEAADGRAWEALAAAVGVVCAQLWRPDVDPADLMADVPAESVVRFLAAIAAGLSRGAFADDGAAPLRDLGELAATRGNPIGEG